MIEWQKNPIACLDNLKGALRRKILRKAITAACKVMRGPVKAAVPVRSGKLKKSIAQKVYTSRRKSVVGLIGGRKNLGPHLHLVDQGTKERRTKKSGRRTGRVVGQDFMAKTYNANVNRSLQVVRDVVADELHNEMTKATSR